MFIDDSEPNRKAVESLKNTHPDIKLDVYHPNDLSEMMMGTMNNQEKAKHAKNLKRLKKDTSKQGDQYMEEHMKIEKEEKNLEYMILMIL